MKKLVTGIAAAALVLSMGGMTSNAAQANNAHYYVDDNKDGICDTCGISCAFVDGNGDGICDNYSSHSSCIGSHGCGNANANGTTGSGGHHGRNGGHGRGYGHGRHH